MSHIVDFLERLAQDAQLRHASRSDLGLALTGLQIDPQVQLAILAQDQRQLEALLKVSVNRCPYMADDSEQEDEFILEQCA